MNAQAVTEVPTNVTNPVNAMPNVLLTEWSILAVIAVLLIRHLLAVNIKLIDEIIEENEND